MIPRSAFLPLAALLAFLVCYALNARLVTGGDTLAHLAVAASLWESGDFDLAEYAPELRDAQGRLPYYLVQEEDGRVRTIFSFFPGVLLAPAGAVLPLLGAPPGMEGWAWAGKGMNALLAAGSGALLWFLLRRRTSEGFAVTVTLAFWIATPLWPLSMCYLQHQPTILFQFAALALLAGGTGDVLTTDPRRLAAAGLCLGCAVLARYQVALVALPTALALAWMLRHAWRAWLCFAAGAAIPAAALLLYNRSVVGSMTDVGYVVYPWATLGAPPLTTTAALFLNPSKGLLLHSPWLALGALGLWQAARALRPGAPSPTVLLQLAALTPWPLVLLYGNYTGWFGGWSWGYRFLLDVLPQATLLAAFGAWPLWQRTLAPRLGFGALIALGIGVQAIGALTWDNAWHARHDLGTVPHQAWLWQGRHAQPLWYLRRGLLYLGTRPVRWREDPFATRGLYNTEQWGPDAVAWTEPQGASFYHVAREHPMPLRFFTPGTPGEEVRVTVLLNGREAVARQPFAGGSWHTVVLPQVPFQHGVVVTVRTDKAWQEPGADGRALGVAVALAQ